MGLFDKFNKESIKSAALAAKSKIDSGAAGLGAKASELAGSASEAIKDFDYAGTKTAIIQKTSAATESIKDVASDGVAKVKDFDYTGAGESIKTKASELGNGFAASVSESITAAKNFDYANAKDQVLIKFDQLSDGVADFKDKAGDMIKSFDFDEAKETAVQYSQRSADKLNSYFRNTFELDKSTFDMVEDIRKRLPTPVQSIDDIYEQCRKEAIRRAIAAFMLGDIIDQKSQAKYDKLSDSYDTYRHEQKATFGNYSRPGEIAKAMGSETLTDEYNPSETLNASGGIASVDHVTSRKEIFSSLLLKAGMTNEELGKVVNHPDNLKLMAKSLNSQKSDMDMYDWLGEFSRPHPDDPGKLIVTIKSSKKEFVVDKKAVDEMYATSKEHIRAAKIAAAKEIGTTVVVTGATMAAQQVVGLIVIETIDVFMDELKRIRLISSEGIIQEIKNSKERLTDNLNRRFEERQIWARAKALGLEAGVAGALSVIPQILISLILKMPAFVYAIIRESTLSVVRAIRVLASNESDKYAALQVILFGAASAVAGIYVQRVISQGIATVPLLNKFNPQVSSVLSGMLVTAIPLVAIYTFEQNKSKLMLRLRHSA